MTTTEEECIEALRHAAEKLRESPTKAQYEALGLTPASGTIIRVMGGWNAAKEAAGLETYEPGQFDEPGQFGGRPIQPMPDGVDIPEEHGWEELNPQQRWYYKNREWRIEVKSKRKSELRRWLFEHKRDECECVECGEDHPGCLEFHHVGEKRMDVSRMVNHGFAKAEIAAEIDACVVLCANCHRKEHYRPPEETVEPLERDGESQAEKQRRP